MLVALMLLPVPLTGQAVYPTAQHRCTAYDSLMAGARHDRPGITTVSRDHGARKIHVTGAAVISERDRGILGVGATILGDSGVGLDSVSVQLNVQVAEPNERSIEERQATLLIDDSLHFDLGTLAQTPGLTFHSGMRTWYLFGFAPRATLLALARAKKAEITIGETRWKFPPKAFEDWRGALAAYVCPAPR
jgi:hypothetical protein